MSGEAVHAKPRFGIGDRVRVDDRAEHGHCRTPLYLKGKRGTIAHVHGAYRDPERLAYHLSGLPAQVLYKVRFAQADLWPSYEGAASDQLEVDIYEHWLTPVS